MLQLGALNADDAGCAMGWAGLPPVEGGGGEQHRNEFCMRHSAQEARLAFCAWSGEYSSSGGLAVIQGLSLVRWTLVAEL